MMIKRRKKDGNVSKYTIMLKVLDNICNTAPENFKSYHLEKKTEQEIDSIRSKAYIHLFLLVKFGIIDFKTRHDYITDGSADGGLDAYYIDEEQKIIYMIQSKFRANSTNFENKEISADELTAMEIDRILDGEPEGEDGVAYNGKIKGFQAKLSKISDLPRYKYKIIILVNLSSERLLQRLFGNYEKEIFNYEKTYSELVFPVCSSTYYKNQRIVISMDIEGKIEEVNETFTTSFGDCDVSLLFVPLIDIAKMIGKYKNSILEYNPRNYLSLRKNNVNRSIETSVNENNSDFSLLNNGITLVCSQYESTTRTGKNNTTKVTIEDPQIINGGQTAFTLAKILDNADDELVNKLKAKKVLLKVISIYQEEGKNKEYRDFVNKISDATNRQTKIDEADRRANQSVQINLQTDIFEKFGYFYERKAGEFEEALSKKIIENDMIIKRDIMLKVIWAYHGKCGEARNNSGDKIFKKDVFDSIMESGISAERAVYSYLIHKEILCLEKLHKKNDYNSAEWGNAIRYGKFAVLSAYVAQYRDEEWSEENITQRLMELLSQWKAFESFVKTKESNKKYFSDVEEFDNYYKSVNVNSDVQEYFGV